MIREFEVNEQVLKGKDNKCKVCSKNFKIREKIILCPIQNSKKGYISAMAIPIHTECYWVENE